MVIGIAKKIFNKYRIKNWYSLFGQVNSFYISKFLFTQKEYFILVNENQSHFQSNGRLPVERVNWFDTINYCNLLSLSSNLNPTYNYEGKLIR